MKRCWFGGGLLLLLLLAGLLTSREMGRFCRELAEDMGRAAVLTEEDREEAQILADRVQEKWEKHRKFAAMLTDHAPMEKIEEDFHLLTPEAEEDDFRETCLRLASQLEAMGDDQLLTLENLL